MHVAIVRALELLIDNSLVGGHDASERLRKYEAQGPARSEEEARVITDHTQLDLSD